MKSIHLRRTLCIMLSVICIFACMTTGCHRQKETVNKTGFYFDTVITITLYDKSYEPLLDECFQLADYYEKLFSATVSGSDIDRINQSNGTPVTVDDETIALLNTGLKYCTLSEGKFDITIGSLSSLWNFSNNNGTVPDADKIADAVSCTDYHSISINGNTVTVSNPQTRIDLGGIAKGYIADKMKEYLNKNGVTEGIINLGGNVLTVGPKDDKDSYTIGIQKPFSEDGTAMASIDITDATVVSSGVYERYFYVDDVLYHHILDPATGYPYENNLLGVTIICPHSVDADALSTTCFALGLTDGMQLIESLEDTEAIFITDDDKMHTSSGIGTTIPFREL